MATWTKLNGFVEHLMEGVHAFGTHQLAVALSNTAPGSEGTPPTGSTAACVLANVTQVSYTNLSTRNVTTASSAQSGGTYTAALTPLVLTSTGGSTGPFRYIYLYNETPTSPADPLICYTDYGSALTLAAGESLTLDFAANSIQLT